MAGVTESFTDQTVKSARPRDTEYDIRDRGGRESVPGLLMRVHPTGNKVYYAQVARGKRVKIGDAKVITLKKARIDAKRILGMAADGHDFQAERLRQKNINATTLGGYIDGPFKDYAEVNIASHGDMIARVKKSFAPWLKKPMAEITDLDMRRWRKGRDGVALETMKRELTYLKAVLNRAIKDRVIPTHQISAYKVTGTLQDGEGNAKVRFLTLEEETRLRTALDAREAKLRAARHSANAWRSERGHDLLPEIGPDEYADHLKPIVLLALNCGLRRGDLFDLQWQHVDLGRRQVRKVISKSSHAKRKAGKKAEPAVLPLSAEAQKILTQCKRQRDPSSDYVFPSPISGNRLDNMKKSFVAILKSADIAGFRFHDLRHTFASRLVMAGVDINTVRELMTHSDIKMTLIYSHLTDDHKAAALERTFGGAA